MEGGSNISGGINMNRFIRTAALSLALLCAAGASYAYRLVVIPVAETLPEGTYKFEAAAIHNDAGGNGWLPCYKLDAGVAKNIEFGIKLSGAPGHFDPSTTQANLQWQIAGETANTPGYGVGVWNLYDSGGNVNAKMSLFAGAFKSFKINGLPLPVKAHLLVGTKQLHGVFGGVSVPFSEKFNIAAEYIPNSSGDTRPLLTPGVTSHLAVAVGYNFTPNFRVKLADVGGDIGYGIVYTNVFK
jgi:hypothetical protein